MMTPEQFEQTMIAFLHSDPFQPFMIELDDGESWVVGRPQAVMYQGGKTAVYFPGDGEIHFVDSEGVRGLVKLVRAASN
jgi:hypothetical protein